MRRRPRGRKRERQLRRARAEQHKSARAAYLAAILKADGFVGADDHGVLRLAWWLVLIFLGALLVEGRSGAAMIFDFDGFALIPVKIQAIARAGSMCSLAVAWRADGLGCTEALGRERAD